MGTYPNPNIRPSALAPIIADLMGEGNFEAIPKGPANGDIVGYYPAGLLIKDRAVKSRHIDFDAVKAENIDAGAIHLRNFATPTPTTNDYFI